MLKYYFIDVKNKTMISKSTDYWRSEQTYFLQKIPLQVEIDQPLQLAYINLLICEKGTARFTINFIAHTLKEGDILFVADDAHVILRYRSEDFLASGCFLKREFAAEVAYELPNPLFNYLHDHPILKASKDFSKALDAWQTQLWFIYQETSKYQRIMLRNHLQNLFLSVVNLVPGKNIDQKQKQSRQERLCWRFWDLITKHAKAERSVQFYANKLAITPYYLAKISQVILNDAPKILIDRQVILEIKRLLANTQNSIEQIAEILHFTDPSYLSRYFKKQTQMTLSEFRKQNL